MKGTGIDQPREEKLKRFSNNDVQVCEGLTYRTRRNWLKVQWVRFKLVIRKNSLTGVV